MASFDIIKKLTEAFGPCGLEDEVTKIIYESISPLCDECGYSPMGGVWGFVKGKSSETVRLITASVDEVTFMVGDIDDNGFVRPKKLTKHNAGSVCAKKVIVGNEDNKFEGIMSGKVLHLASGDDRQKPNVEKSFVDLGFTKKDELAGKIEKGDFITFNEKLESFGKNKLIGKALSTRAGAALMIEALEGFKKNGTKPETDVAFFFAVKEFVGLGDTFWSVQKFNPSAVLLLSALPAINTEKEAACKMDEGIVIPSHDNNSLYFGNEIYSALIKSDIKTQIPTKIEEHQRAASAQCAAAGCDMINVSIPVRNIYSAGEIVSLSDLDEMAKAIEYFAFLKI